MLKDSPRYSHHHECIKGQHRIIQRLQRMIGRCPQPRKSLPRECGAKAVVSAADPSTVTLSSMVGQSWTDVHARIPEKLRGELRWLIRSERDGDHP